MLGILPLATLFIAFVLIYAWRCQDVEKPGYVAQALLYAITAWGMYLALLSEVLGRFGALRFGALLAAWGILFAALLILGWRAGLLGAGLRALGRQLQTLTFTRIEQVAVIAGSAVILALFVIAWVAPPNNNDALAYHLPRVMHWAQSGSLSHYPVAYEFQLHNAIWAELVILHTFVLSGVDRFANLVQWLSMLGCLAVTAGIAAQFGAGRLGRLLAMIFVLTLPMGVLQASSAQTDYVASFWVLALAFWAVKAYTQKLDKPDWFAIGGSVGLGMLTKGTFYPFALPFVIVLGLALLRQWGWKRGLLTGLGITLLVVLLNVGFLWRNYQTYQSFLGPQWWVEEKSMESITPGAVSVNLVRNLSAHLGTPFASVNDAFAQAVIGFCRAAGQEPCVNLRDSGQYTYRIPLLSNHEDSAGNPLHLVLILSAGVLLGLTRGPRQRVAIAYVFMVVAAYVILSATILWELYGSRYQLPFFVLWGPVLGVSVEWLGRRRLAYSLAFLLLFAAFPWVVFNRTRPLIGWQPRMTSAPSIFTASRNELMLIGHPVLAEPYPHTAKAFLTTGCKSLGLSLDSRDPEYPLWALIEPYRHGIRIEALRYEPSLARYGDAQFHPCAVICTICGDTPQEAGLPLVFRDHGVSLYLDPTYALPPQP